ncbi:hypothetical protein CEXT_151411 [Caerostris extrusa]|uniref:Uncharacterized protein n=1 Tax=Caerostris extrusa TaxID=172846 RepID=A0AAV4M6R3_CAEEX|nr:hypothetical protein CEXT_151411 [Caerostris extrusa]
MLDFETESVRFEIRQVEKKKEEKMNRKILCQRYPRYICLECPFIKDHEMKIGANSTDAIIRDVLSELLWLNVSEV